MSVQRVFLDSNVIVSGLAYEGNEARVLELADSGRIRLVIVEHVLVEAQDALESKLNRAPGIGDGYMAGLDYELAPVPSPEDLSQAAGVLRDPGDVIILASILAAAPDVALTGDKDLLTDEVRAIAPTCRCAEYLDRLRPDTDD